MDAEAQAHHELVEKVVRRLVRELDLSCDPEDLRGWGQQGLLEAKTRFDASRGVRFSTYAYYRVRGSVIDGVRKQGWLRRRAYAKLKAFGATDQVCESVAETSGSAPDVAERAAQIGDILGKISAAYLLSALGQGSDDQADTPEQQVDLAMTRKLVQRELAELPERERSLLQAIYFEDATIEEAGARLGLSKSWASRMHAKALERLRKSLAISLG